MKKIRKNTVIITILLIALFIVTFGLTYAYEIIYENFFTDGVNNQLVLGDIYMHYDENNQGITLTDVLPSSTYNPNKYFEFTISGKNTYTKKDIYYEILLTHGDSHQTRTERIRDDLLKFRLVEVNSDNTENVLINSQSYSKLIKTRIHVNTIPKNTASEISKKYRLYMWISDETVIGGGDAEYDYDLDTWNNDVYASIKVKVNGDFGVKTYVAPPEKARVETMSDLKNDILYYGNNSTLEDTDGTIYISGTSDRDSVVEDTDVDYNYVWYSGKLWRITSINSDETVKLITDEVISTGIDWGKSATVSETDSTSTYPDGHIREWLNYEFLPTLYNHTNILKSDAGWYSIVDSNQTPIKPTGEYTLTDPIGILNSYEYYMAYKNVDIYKNYLNVGYNWALMTPYNYSNSSYVNYSGGKIYNTGTATGVFGIRPSIVLKNDINIIGGTGIRSNPYLLDGDQEKSIPYITLLNSRMSGEYVKLENDSLNRVFRIVDTETSKNNETGEEKLITKIVLNDYVRNGSSVLTKRFSASLSQELWTEISKTDTTYWRGYLNTTWLNTLDINMLVKGTYYLGYNKTTNYKLLVCAEDNDELSVKDCIKNGNVVANKVTDDYVGLLRTTELFSSQFGNGSSSSMDMWVITPYTTNSILLVSISCQMYYSELSYTIGYAVRPTIHLNDEVVIKSGSGTEQDPFVVGLRESEA